MKPMTTEEFRERIKTICGARPKEEKPCVRKPTDRGYYPPERTDIPPTREADK